MGLHRGDRVRHPKWGPGTVVARLVVGRVRVRFDAESLPRILWSRELVAETVPESPAGVSERTRPAHVAAGVGATPGPVEPEASSNSRRVRPGVRGTPLRQPPVSVPRTRPTTRPLPPADAWQTLEALRLGVVPARGVRQYTVAREQELHDFETLLARGQGCRVLWGDYGSGKTHMLEAVEQLALESGFAVARITLDPREHALHHPLRLYRKVMAGVRTIDQATPGFEPIFEELVDNASHRDPRGAHASRFFSPYLHALHTGNLDAIGWLRDYVGGDKMVSTDVNFVLSRIGWRGPGVLAMSDFRTYGRMYIHLVGTLASWCGDAGHRGLVLLFDEVERVDTLDPSNQHYAFEVLRHYAAVTMQQDDLAFDPEQLYKGGQPVHRKIPLRFREDQPLVTVFALTPLAEIEASFASVTRSTDYDVSLQPLAKTSVYPLVERIGALYGAAYDEYPPSPKVLRAIAGRIEGALEEGHDRFRDAVRAAVFLLDQARFEQRGRAGG